MADEAGRASSPNISSRHEALEAELRLVSGAIIEETERLSAEATKARLLDEKRIASAHHGSLTIESELGVGTTVRIRLPTGIAREPVTGRAKADHSISSRRILVVDDEPKLRRSVERILAGEGYHVTLAASGAEALHLVGTGDAFDLVLLDMTMPVLDGTETLSLLHELQPSLGVVLMSGYHEYAKPERLKSLDVLGFVAKPFSADEILQMLAKALRITRSPRWRRPPRGTSLWCGWRTQPATT